MLWKPFKIFYLLMKETFEHWLEDRADRLAAALAFYTIFALAPILILVILPVLITLFSRRRGTRMPT